MKRTELREHIFRMIFRVEFHTQEEYEEQLNFYIEGLAEPTEDEMTYLLEKSQKVIDKIPELDTQLNDKITGWKTDRMGRVELSIARLALYEILFDDDIPSGVAINEAVELAKRYGSTDAPSFINGVLAKYV